VTFTTTLSALLAHPSAASISLLTPAAGLSKRVTSVLLARDVTARPDRASGSLLIVLDEVSRNDWRLDALVSRVHAADVTALLLSGHDPLGVATSLLAHRLGLPVLGAPDPLWAYSTFTDLLSRPEVEQARIVRAAAALCAIAGDDPVDVVHGLADVFERPVALLDHAARAVVGPELVLEEERKALLRGLAQRPATLAHPFVEQVEGGEILALAVTQGQSWLCVNLPAPLSTERDAVLAALPIAVSALRERLAERRLQLERNARARTSALEEITRHPTVLSTSLRRRALDLGWQLDGWHVGIYVGLLEDLDLMAARADLLAAFASEALDIQAVEQVDGWAAWTTAAGEPSSEDAVRHAAAVRRAQRRFESSAAIGTYVGVGRARNSAEGIASSLLEARDAARLARNRDETGRFLHVDRLGFGQLLLGWTRTDSFRPAADALLDPLARASGDLIATLGTYLDCESSLAHAAAVLGVHRNTVAARIARVQELLGVDLANPDERLALHLACKSIAPRHDVQNGQ
jgi:purine catabolism regulator